MQWKKAEEGEWQAMKWLGANELGQSDKHEVENSGDIILTITRDDAAL